MLYTSLLRPLLFALTAKDPEVAHQAAMKLMRVAQKNPATLQLVSNMFQPRHADPVEVAGIKFPHRLGLAAGFDKECEVLPFLQAAGFAFVEAGTIVPEPQPGNPRPRMFRLPEHRALINRMGFNSSGAIVAANNLAATYSSINIPIGISIGPNLKTPKDPEPVIEDCIKVLDYTGQYADYAVINLSSPNTQGLRGLQQADKSQPIVETLSTYLADTPLFVKFTSDMGDDELRAAAEMALKAGAAGFVMSNTTMGRVEKSKSKHMSEKGGLSGYPLFIPAVRGISLLRSISSLAPIIGVGGIEDYEGGKRMIDAGADLLQVYTALIYQGFGVVRNVLGE